MYLMQKGGLVLLDQRLLRAERTGREAGKGGIRSCCLRTRGCHLIFGSPGWCPVAAAGPWGPQPPGMLPTQSGSTVPGKLGLQGK